MSRNSSGHLRNPSVEPSILAFRRRPNYFCKVLFMIICPKGHSITPSIGSLILVKLAFPSMQGKPNCVFFLFFFFFPFARLPQQHRHAPCVFFVLKKKKNKKKKLSQKPIVSLPFGVALRVKFPLVPYKLYGVVSHQASVHNPARRRRP